jgi:DMSO reductase anchor subunit
MISRMHAQKLPRVDVVRFLHSGRLNTATLSAESYSMLAILAAAPAVSRHKQTLQNFCKGTFNSAVTGAVWQACYAHALKLCQLAAFSVCLVCLHCTAVDNKPVAGKVVTFDVALPDGTCIAIHCTSMSAV